MASDSFRRMLAAATERSRQADMNWARDPDVRVTGFSRPAQRAYQPFPKPSIPTDQTTYPSPPSETRRLGRLVIGFCPTIRMRCPFAVARLGIRML